MSGARSLRGGSPPEACGETAVLCRRRARAAAVRGSERAWRSLTVGSQLASARVMTGPTRNRWCIEVQAEPTQVQLRAQRAEHDEALRSLATSVGGAVDRLADWLSESPRGYFEVVVAGGEQRQTLTTTSASIALHFVVNALENLMVSPSNLPGPGGMRARDPDTHSDIHRILTALADRAKSAKSKVTAGE